MPPPRLPAREGGGSLAYDLRWGTADSDRTELGLECERRGIGSGGGVITGGEGRGGGGRGIFLWPTIPLTFFFSP